MKVFSETIRIVKVVSPADMSVASRVKETAGSVRGETVKSLENLNKRYGIKSVYLVSVTLLILVGILISFFVDSVHKRFEIEGVRFTFESLKDRVWTFRDNMGQTLIVRTENYQYRLDSDSGLLLTYGNQRIKQTSDFKSFTSSIYSNDTLIYTGALMPIEFEMLIDGESEAFLKSSAPFEKKLIIGVLRVAEHIQSSNLIYFILFNLFMIVLGTAQVFFPLFFWQLKHMLDVQGGEPTDFYMTFTRIVGVIMTGVGIFYPLFYWLL